MTGVELFLGGMAAIAVLSTVVRARSRNQRARAAAQIAQAGTSPVSLIGRMLVTTLAVVGVQWFVVTHSADPVLWWVVLGLPALVTGYTVTRATTVMRIDAPRRSRGDCR